MQYDAKAPFIVETHWQIEEVLDGDSIIISHRFTQMKKEIRLYGLDAPEVKAILCGRGGYGVGRIIDQLDFTAFKKNPKWIIGFSDITVLHNHLNTLGYKTIHGIMPVSIPKATLQAKETLKKALFNNPSNSALERTGEGLFTLSYSSSNSSKNSSSGIQISCNSFSEIRIGTSNRTAIAIESDGLASTWIISPSLLITR